MKSGSQVGRWVSSPREIGDKGLTKVPISMPKYVPLPGWYLWLPAALRRLSPIVVGTCRLYSEEKESQPLAIGVRPGL